MSQIYDSTRSARGWRLNWALGTLTIVAIVGTLEGSRVALVVEDVSFAALLVLMVLYLVMAWWRLRQAWRKEATARWKAWTSLAGCMALSAAYALPLTPFFYWFVLRWGFGPRWDYKMMMFGFGLASFLLGVVAARGVRFPLIVGGFVIALTGLVIRVGV